ncbi:MAG: hypothetical protein FWD04_08035, partial [Conexibacteraceae bacterium]|nr:hypothetical protein [Conexibacteraceae bacterium]
DLTSRRALRFGVTAAVGADRAYDESQAFAARAAQDGFAGIRYFLRHDPAARLYGITLFGEPGQPATDDRRWPEPTTGEIPDEVIQTAWRKFGYRVVTTP